MSHHQVQKIHAILMTSSTVHTPTVTVVSNLVVTTIPPVLPQYFTVPAPA